jgi:hypothetical protein
VYLVEAADALLLVDALDAVEYACIGKHSGLHPHAHGVERIRQDVGQRRLEARLNECPASEISEH